MPFSSAGRDLNRRYNTFHYLLHAPSFARLFWRLYQDKRVWFLPKLVLAIGIIYAVWPLDAVPGFPLVGIGYLDDAVVLYLAAKAFIRMCPANVVQEHVQLIDQGG